MTDKSVFVVFGSSDLYEKTSKFDTLLWAHSASDSAEEVPKAPKNYQSLTFRAPGRLIWHSQRLTVPTQVYIEYLQSINIYGASNMCMNIYRAFNICMIIHGASNICMHIQGASNMGMNI